MLGSSFRSTIKTLVNISNKKKKTYEHLQSKAVTQNWIERSNYDLSHYLGKTYILPNNIYNS